MNTAAQATIANLTELHFTEYPDGPPVILDTLGSGDYALTRVSPDATVTFIDIIDKDTGEFMSTARHSDKAIIDIATTYIEEHKSTLDAINDR